MKKEEEKVEENILRFTEQQQATLQALETRVRQDRNILLMLVYLNNFSIFVLKCTIKFSLCLGDLLKKKPQWTKRCNH